MNTYFKLTPETASREVCTRPTLGELLPDYILDLLADPAAEELEDHLLECRHCKDKYLTILRVRGAAMRARGQEAAEQDENVEDERLQETAVTSGES